MNLLDTPGHKDFSEDTYRVLTAVMGIDAGEGIESQTRLGGGLTNGWPESFSRLRVSAKSRFTL